MKSDSLSDLDAKLIGRIRNEGIVECNVSTLKTMKGDGHCLFHALAYFTDYDAVALRSLLWRLSTSDERQRFDLKCLNIMNGSREGWGNTDCVTVFSRLFNVNVCVHAYENDKLLFVTRMYGSECVDRTECVHLKWNVSESSGHVDLLVDCEISLCLCLDDAESKKDSEDLCLNDAKSKKDSEDLENVEREKDVVMEEEEVKEEAHVEAKEVEVKEVEMKECCGYL